MTPPEGFTYIQDFLIPDAQRSLREQLQQLPFQHEDVRGNLLKRGYAQFGHAYVTRNKTVIPAPPLPGFLTALAKQALPYCPAGTAFNQCIVTWYPKRAGIPRHCDHPRFADCIIAVSLGAPGTLQFYRPEQKIVSYEVTVATGSLYVIHGPARWDYEHEIRKLKSERYSITFRNVPDDHHAS